MKINNQEVRLGWKVVFSGNSGLYGLYSAISPADCAIKYKLNEWTTPKDKCGPLAVFKTRQRAREFKGRYHNHKVLYYF